MLGAMKELLSTECRVLSWMHDEIHLYIDRFENDFVHAKKSSYGPLEKSSYDRMPSFSSANILR